MAHDPVNHPSHYTSHPSGVECIQITRHMSFNIGNVVKYLWRAGLKDRAPTLQDLKKAAWYLNDEIKQIEKTTHVNSQNEVGWVYHQSCGCLQCCAHTITLMAIQHDNEGRN